MNLRDLEYVVSIAELGSLAKAAEHCYVSQSTLSIQLKKLEDNLNVQIFERTNKRVLLTRIGEEIYLIAKNIVQEAAQLKKIARQSTNQFSGDLYIGAFPTLAPYLFPEIIPLLRKQFPELHLFLIEEKTDILIRKLEDGLIDCALIALPLEKQKFVLKKLFTERFYLAVPSTHRLAKKSSVIVEDIQDESLLLLEDGHCLRGQALEFCNRVGIGETSSYRATSLETLRNMIVADMGITVIPQLAISSQTKHIKYIPFRKANPSRTIGLFWRATTNRQNLFEQIGEIIIKATNERLS